MFRVRLNMLFPPETPRFLLTAAEHGERRVLDSIQI